MIATSGTWSTPETEVLVSNPHPSTAAMPNQKADLVAKVLEAAIEANSPAARHAAYGLLRRKLPPGVPLAVVTRFWAEQMAFSAIYHRLRVTPDEYTDAVLAGLRAWKSPAATFLVVSVEGEPTAETLRAANRAFYVLANHPTPYTPKGRAAIRATLTDARYLAGATAAVAAHGWRGDGLSFFRALVYEGGDGAVDTLRPWLRAAMPSRDRVELENFARFAETPKMKALFAALST